MAGYDQGCGVVFGPYVPAVAGGLVPCRVFRMNARTPGPDLNLIHRIDQAQASAFVRIENLLAFINDWMTQQGFTVEQISDALDNPMMFMALTKLLEQKVDVREYPNMLAAAIIRISREMAEGAD